MTEMKKKSAVLPKGVDVSQPNVGLAQVIQSSLRSYFRSHDQILPQDLYHHVLKEVEKCLITETLSFTKGNQKKASQVLGIHRNTLRTKIKEVA